MQGRKELLRIIGLVLLLSLVCSFTATKKSVADYSLQAISVTLDWSFETNDYIASSPSVADLDQDGQLEILFGSTDNKFYCIKLVDVASSGDCPWYSFRGSVLNTGWMDSDNDLIDDLTENYLANPNYPYTNTGNTTFEIAISPIITISLGMPLIVMKIRKKFKRKL